MTQPSVQSFPERPVPQATALTGEATLPANRDLTLVALALGARCRGVTRILRAVSHPDVNAFVENLARIGIQVSREADTLLVGTENGEAPELKSSEEPLDAGDSRIHFACLAGLLAGAPFSQPVTCSIDRKILRPVLDALEALDVRLQTDANDPGVALIVGIGGRRPKKGTVRLESVDEAVKAAIFLAGLAVEGATICYQPGAGDETVEPLFKSAGCLVEKERVSDEEGYRLELSGPSAPNGVEHDLPGDPDGALYLILTAALLPKSEMILTNVGVDWKSRRIVEVARRMNAELAVERARTTSRFPIRRITVKGSELRATRFGAELTQLFLNEIPFLSIIGACANGEAIIRDAIALRNGWSPELTDENETSQDTESGAENDVSPDGEASSKADSHEPDPGAGDTLAVTVTALRDLGVKVGEMPDGLVVQGGYILQGTTLDARNEERVAVALLLAGMAAEGTTIVQNSGSVDDYYGPILEIADNLAQKRRVKA